MKMSSLCYPCFASQILNITQKLGLNVEETRDTFAKLFEIVTSEPVESSSPVIAMKIRDYVYQNLSQIDLYLDEKARGNSTVAEFADILGEKIELSVDPLLQAAKIAILGNIIDYGIPSENDSSDRLAPLLEKEEELIANTPAEFFEYEKFREEFFSAKKLLYITDNTGEIVLDGLFIKTMKNLRPELEIVCATRDKAILNDALLEDAQFVGIDRHARLISSGCSAPGTVFEFCSAEFMAELESADLVISKGQGNFETLTNEKLDVYFMLMVKCKVVAQFIGCDEGNLLLKKFCLR
ncbi:MAG: DUF89 family protein [Spirochaetales bacterium]|nr:DUF89 family protein [Spirochaetales bacterium]